MKKEKNTQPNQDESKSPKDLFKEVKIIKECLDIEITELLIKRKGDIVEKIRLIANDGELYVYTPKKTISTKSELGGIPTVEDKQELFSISEILIEYPILKEIHKEIVDTGKALIVGTYMRTNRWSDFESAEVWHNWFYKSQFDTIYFEPYHKTDKSNLAVQIKARDDREKKRLGETL